MPSIWDDDEPAETSNENPSTALVQQPSPAEVLFFNQQKVKTETDTLLKSMSCCESIVRAAHGVADHVPILVTAEAREFWEGRVSSICKNKQVGSLSHPISDQ